MSRRLLVSGVALAALVTACSGVPRTAPPEVTGGDPRRGLELVAAYDCGTCHVVTGVTGADGRVGPSLEGFGEQMYIAGALPNTGPNLTLWISDPQLVEPGTAMPDLGVSEQEARDIAAYLFSDG